MLIYQNKEVNHPGLPTEEELLFILNKVKQTNTPIRLYYETNDIHHITIYKNNTMEDIYKKIERR